MSTQELLWSGLYPLYPLFPCSDFVSQMWGWFGGGGVMFFSHFMLFFIFLEKNIWEYKIILSHLMGGGGVWIFFFEKCPFTYWLNGRWFLQIVERDSWHLYIHYILYSLRVHPITHVYIEISVHPSAPTNMF